MPPRQPSSNSRSPRRRPGPAMPGGWVWLVFLAIVIGAMFLFEGLTNQQTIKESEFKALLRSGYVAKLVIIGNNRVDGEVRNLDRIPDDLRAPLKGNSKFTARIAEEKNKLVQELDAYNNEKGERDGRIEYSSEEERNWFGPLMVTLLPVFLLLGIFFLFILPRFRDPLAGGGFLSNYIKGPARRYERNKLR